jgi:hypothetical protein
MSIQEFFELYESANDEVRKQIEVIRASEALTEAQSPPEHQA